MDATRWPGPGERAEAEARLTARLHELARAVGLPAPPIEAGPWDGAEYPEARPVRRGQDRRIVYTTGFPETSAAEQYWQLARCLAVQLSSRLARRIRWARRLSRLVLLAPALALLVARLVDDFGPVDVPRSLGLSIIAAQVVGVLAAAWIRRRAERATDAGAFDVLRRAGHDPVEVLTTVYEDTTRFSWWQRLQRMEPTRDERLVAAGRWAGRPRTSGSGQLAPPLH